MRFSLIVAVLMAILVGVAQAQTSTTTVAGSVEAGETTRSADKFRASACANTHFHYGDTPYGNHAEVVRALDRLGPGVTIRDGIVSGANQPWQLEGWRDAYEQGHHRVVLQFDPRSGSLDDLTAPIEEGEVPGLRAVEGPNEWNATIPDSWQLVSPPRPGYVFLQDWMSKLVSWRDAADLGVPVIDWSPTTWQAAQEAKSAGSAAVDAGNVHVYAAGRNIAPGGANEDSGWASDIENARNMYVYDVFGPGFPWVITETGYHTSREFYGQPIGWHHGVSEAVQSAYTMNSLLEGFWYQSFDTPEPLTCMYELLDGSCPNCAGPENWPADWHHQNNFGLFHKDYSPKPAAIGFRNLLRVMDRAGSRDTPVQWSYDLTGPDATPGWYHFRYFGLRDGGGNKLLAVWRPDSLWDRATYTERHQAPKDATLSDGSVRDFEVYQPSTSSAALKVCRGSALTTPVRAESPTIIRIRRTLATRNPGAC
jgi:hypothetical protein